MQTKIDTTSTKPYEYTYKETSVDTRVWTITSSKQLTEEEVEEYGMESGTFGQEGKVEEISDSQNGVVKIKFDGTEYGDDTQLEVEGDTIE